MTLEMAEKIHRFLENNSISSANLMGGEFFCHPRWQEILDILTCTLAKARLVTNGDWAADPTLANEVIRFLTTHQNIYVSVSFDQWHTNRHVDRACSLLKKNNIRFNIAKNGEEPILTSDGLVPVGRADLQAGFYGFMGNYCSKPDHKYSFLIDENGTIYKCAFGIWDYADVDEYLDGGFAARFKEFNTVFYQAFINNCQSCSNVYQFRGHKKRAA